MQSSEHHRTGVPTRAPLGPLLATISLTLLVSCGDKPEHAPTPDAAPHAAQPTPSQTPQSATGGDPTRGEALLQTKACTTCHTTDPNIPSTGPTFAGLYGSEVYLTGGSSVTADDDYLRESIISPLAKLTEGYQPAMPNYEGQLTDQEIDDILAYLKTLATP